MATTLPTSTVDIEDLALDLGATLEYATGGKFNSDGRIGNRLPKQTQQPVSALTDKLLRSVLAKMAEPAQPTQVTITQAPPLAQPPTPQDAPAVQPRCAWVFSFERNADGTIKTLTATPQSL
jgi:hypothetical protein